MLVSVESTDKFDSSTLSVDCSQEKFSAIEASLHQVLHRTTPIEIGMAAKDDSDSSREEAGQRIMDIDRTAS